jgi:hypothetical protein
MGEQDHHVRMSLPMLGGLEALLARPAAPLSGADIGRRTGLPSATLHPRLLRLERAGWFVSRWEPIDPGAAGRPRCRLYRVTRGGLARANEALASFAGRGVPV